MIYTLPIFHSSSLLQVSIIPDAVWKVVLKWTLEEKNMAEKENRYFLLVCWLAIFAFDNQLLFPVGCLEGFEIA